MPDAYQPNHSGYFTRPPKSAKTASSPRDALIPSKRGSERPQMILPSLLVYVVPGWPADESPTAHIVFTRPTLRLLRTRFPVTCHGPGRGFSDFPLFAFRGTSQTVLSRAPRTSTFLSCAFREQEGWSGCCPSCSSETAHCASTLLAQ